jgi:Zn-dependent M28 family amino/carboxypeptidase
VVTFGANEIGLFGSQAFVEAQDANEAKPLLNFDMIGVAG